MFFLVHFPGTFSNSQLWNFNKCSASDYLSMAYCGHNICSIVSGIIHSLQSRSWELYLKHYNTEFTQYLIVSSHFCGRYVLVVRAWHTQWGQAGRHLVHPKGTGPSVVAGSQGQRTPKPDQVAGWNTQVSSKVRLPELQNIHCNWCTDFTIQLL